MKPKWNEVIEVLSLFMCKVNKISIKLKSSNL